MGALLFSAARGWGGDVKDRINLKFDLTTCPSWFYLGRQDNVFDVSGRSVAIAQLYFTV